MASFLIRWKIGQIVPGNNGDIFIGTKPGARTSYESFLEKVSQFEIGSGPDSGFKTFTNGLAVQFDSVIIVSITAESG
jgi:hypothetical protein